MPEKRALMIGLNYPGTAHGLNGCINDVKMLKELLISRFGFPDENITLLLDTEGETKPTLDAILSTLKQKVAETQTGDVLFLHYSGHGTQIPDDEAEESDRHDEALVTGDGAPLRDDMLQEVLSALPPGVKFTFIADCCHSGSMLDQPKQQVSGDKTQDDPVVQPAEPAEDVKHRGLDFGAYRDLASDLASGFGGGGINAGALTGLLGGQLGNVLTQVVSSSEAGGALPVQGFLSFLQTNKPVRPAELPANLESAVLISGCQDNETSADACINGQYNGALTFGIITVLNQNPGNISNKQLCMAVRDYLENQQYKQNPCLSCQDSQINEPFICAV